MGKLLCLCLSVLCLADPSRAQSQQRTTTLVQSILDESIVIATDKPVYFPDDTLRITVGREDNTITSSVTPIVVIQGMKLTADGHDRYSGIIPEAVTPGSYRILLRIVDAKGQRFIYETDRVVNVEEYQAVEQLDKFVELAPMSGSSDPQTAQTMDGDQIRALQVRFRRGDIGQRMGPQFVTIRTTILLRDGTTTQSFERRVVTFRSHGNPERDRAVFIQYRTAYGPYAVISPDELEHVHLPLDSLPSWAMIKVSVEPDYTIKIGAYERTNSYTRYFRVRGPSIEVGLSLGIPKVLYDSETRDSIDYGNTSAMVRFYHVDEETGMRFPVSFGMGTFGVSSPIDVGVGKGGFAASTYLDVVELTGIRNFGFIKKVSAGLELTRFFPLKHRSRFLINAQVGFAL